LALISNHCEISSSQPYCGASKKLAAAAPAEEAVSVREAAIDVLSIVETLFSRADCEHLPIQSTSREPSAVFVALYHCSYCEIVVVKWLTAGKAFCCIDLD